LAEVLRYKKILSIVNLSWVGIQAFFIISWVIGRLFIIHNPSIPLNIWGEKNHIDFILEGLKKKIINPNKNIYNSNVELQNMTEVSSYKMN